MVSSPKYHTIILAALLTFLVVAVVVVGALSSPGYFYYRGEGYLANVSGFIALFMIAATGILMLFKKPILARTRNPEGLWEVHVIVAGLGGFFLIIHVVFFLAFPLSLPVLLGYAGSGAAVVVWLTGVFLLQDLRSSPLYHAVFSLVGVFLMILHTFGAGRNIPTAVAGISLSVAALIVLIGVAGQAAQAWSKRSKAPI